MHPLLHVARASKAIHSDYHLAGLMAYQRCQLRQLTTSRSQQRKKTKSLQIPRQTTRDRMQNFAKKNLLVKDSLTNRATRLLDLGKTRATWFQQELYKYWNPDYNNTGAQATTLREAVGDSLRPGKGAIIMDTRWWFWNIMFALLPAALITGYCEFRGQYLMHEYYEKMELEQMNRILGEDFVKAHQDELRLPPPQSFLDRLQSSAAEIVSIAFDYFNVNTETDEPQPAPTNSLQEQAESDHATGTEAAVDSIDTSTTAEGLDVNHEAIQTLLKRIQLLEQRIQATPDAPTIQNRIDRVTQTGVQNRAEDELLEKWKTRMAENRARKEQEAKATEELSSMWNTTTVRVTNTISQLWETITQSLDKIEEDPKSNETNEAASEAKQAQVEVNTTNIVSKDVVDPQELEESVDRQPRDEIESQNTERTRKSFWRFW